MGPLKRLLPYLLRYRKHYAVGIILVLFGGMLGAVVPLLLKYAVDALKEGTTREAITWVALAIVLLAVIRGVVSFGSRFIIVSASRHVEYDLRKDLYGKLLSLPVSYYDRHKTGDITSRMINDILGVRMVAAITINLAVGMTFLFLASLGVMLWLKWDLALISITPLILVTAIFILMSPRLHRLSLACQEQLGAISNRAQEHYTSARVVRAFAREKEEWDRFEVECTEYKRRNIRLAIWRGITYGTVGFLTELAIIITLVVGGKGMIAGEVSHGDFVAFTAYIFLLGGPVIAMGWVVTLLLRGSVCMGRICEILDTPSEPDTAPENGTAPLQGKIEIRNLTFRYSPDAPTALSNISLKIEPGWRVAIVGRTGSGKSTLAHMLLRLHVVPDGTIFLDERDINSIPLTALRTSISIVSQDIFLWSDRIRENILFGARGKDTDGEIYRAAEIAQLSADIEKFQDGYDQLIGEWGLTLSGGQRQRVAIARAVIAHPAILILDDALSSIDSHTESEIRRRLQGFMEGRTSLVITHRLITAREADLIVLLEKGRVEETGTHDELIAAGGAYARMWNAQQLEERIDRVP